MHHQGTGWCGPVYHSMLVRHVVSSLMKGCSIRSMAVHHMQHCAEAIAQVSADIQDSMSAEHAASGD